MGQPPYRADQLWQWLYVHLADDFAAMTNLPAGLRRRLAAEAVLHTASPVAETVAGDGMARKLLLRLADGALIETVLMHYVDPADASSAETAVPLAAAPPGERHTVCLSTQAGCAMGCVFCATGQMGLVRDLSRGECVEQVVILARRLARVGQRLSNVVFMGMGEPLANWPGTWGAIETLTNPAGLAMSPRRITVSTVGLAPGIRRLALAGLPVRLAVSLHAADEDLRARLVPVSRSFPLADLLAACREYVSATGRRISFEVVLIRDVNDGPDQARAIARLVRPVRGHVNLIPLNPTAGSDLEPSTPAAVSAFARALAGGGVPVSVRMRRGIDIQAGCGQLRSRVVDGVSGRTVAAVPQAAP